MGPQGFGGGAGAVFQHNNGQGALLPLGIMNGDDRGFLNLRVRHERIFKIDGTDPLATRLDQILRAICDSHVTLTVDGRHISRSEPAIGSPFVTLGTGLEVTRGDPGTSDLELAHCPAVLWADSVRVNRANLDEWYRQSLLGQRRDALLIREICHVRFDRATGSKR